MEPEHTELRELSRYRVKLVRALTSCKDQVHAVLAKLGIPVTCSDIFGPDVFRTTSPKVENRPPPSARADALFIAMRYVPSGDARSLLGAVGGAGPRCGAVGQGRLRCWRTCSASHECYG